MENWLTVKQAAPLLGYHPNHLRRLLRSGAVTGHKQRNGRWTISRREVRRIQDLQTEHGRYYPDSALLSW